ncbi:MAG TPA: HAMP domain-containing sensor histidine kinase [Gudongella oleilytica]|jgi:two-component system phosphate regulon sensor histidine kinase PhoR|nr:HAMP domain-containing sensor histidine kinase [Gudongella oleilytica]
MQNRIYAYLAVIVSITMTITTMAMAFVVYDLARGPGSIENLSFFEVLMSMLPAAVGVLVLLLVTLYLLSHRLADRLMAPIKRIASSVESILSGNPVTEVSIYPEIRPFVDTIDRQKKQIDLALHEMREAEKVRREFTANVSHELKTPLTSIIGYSEMLQNGISNAEDSKKFAGVIHKEGSRLLELIDSVISLSRLEDSNAIKTFESLELYGIVQDLVEKLRFSAKKKSVELSVVGSPIQVRGDRRMVQDLIFNLVDNAIKYNRFGGSVTVSISEEGTYGVMRVTDTGIGIPKDDVERVFERFYRVDKSRSKKVEGTGLGLAIVKHIVEFHGGSVLLDSEVNKGTTITVKLPK